MLLRWRYWQWRYGWRSRPARRRFGVSQLLIVTIGLAAGAASGFYILEADRWFPSVRSTVSKAFDRSGNGTASDITVADASFPLCGPRRHNDCVIDGDTFVYRGEKIRMLDIDAPETHPPRCELEAAWGFRAAARLSEILSDGDFLISSENAGHDQYGRGLRRVSRAGRDLGDILVNEDLARRGPRRTWC